MRVARPQGIKITLQDPTGTVMTTKQADTEVRRCGRRAPTHIARITAFRRRRQTQGRFAFTSIAGGEYLICFSTNSTRWFSNPRKFRVDLKLDVGESGIDYTEVAKKEHLSELEVEVRGVADVGEHGAARGTADRVLHSRRRSAG